MVWIFFILVAVGVVAVVAALVTGRLSADPMADPVSSTPDAGLPAEVTAASIDEVRFDTALRGYRMDQVDDVIDRLQLRIAELEGGNAELAELPEMVDAPAVAAESADAPAAESVDPLPAAPPEPGPGR